VGADARLGPRPAVAVAPVATQNDVRRIVSGLPGVNEGTGRFGFDVEVKGKRKGFCWSWMERVDPKKARVENPTVLAIRVPDLADKDALHASDPDGDKFVDDPHYNGFPAVLVRLKAIPVPQLRELLIDAWRCTAPKALVEDYDRAR
jgi:hypothetical protein